MELTWNSIREEYAAFTAAGYRLPRFDYDKIKENTLTRPVWIHFGTDNTFRSLLTGLVQRLLNDNVLDVGLIAAEGLDYEIMEKGLRPHNGLNILATLNADRSVEKTILGSIVETLILDSRNEGQFGRLKAIFSKPSLQIASFGGAQDVCPEAAAPLSPSVSRLVASDLEAGPGQPKSYMGKVASLLYARYRCGALPIAMVSTEGRPQSAIQLQNSVERFARSWAEKGVADAAFWDYVRDPSKVSFPRALLDKIAPKPDARVEALLAMDGIDGLDPILTSRNTPVVPFVNAEKFECLAMEDSFPNGRPPLEKGGVLFTDRTTLDKIEKMMVCSCLGPLQTALAIFGCLLGFSRIADEMRDPHLRRLAERIGVREGLPVADDPGIVSPASFLTAVLDERLPNPFLPDTPQELASGLSRKLALCFGETIRAYEKDPLLSAGDLKMIPLVIAGWLRYLMGMDDHGKKMKISPDPLLREVRPFVSGYALDDRGKDLSRLDGLLRNQKIFGVDLITAGLAGRIKSYFTELSSGPDAVRLTLKKYV